MSAYKIEVENLNAWYDYKHILIDINMKIKERTVTAIMGPSGCGKTTFIRCLNRMHELVPKAKVSGKVIFNNLNIYDNNVDPTWIRRKIGMVFQKPNPFPMMSIYDNVAFGPKIHGIKKRSILDKIVKQSLEMAGLWEEVKDDLQKPASALSGGQQQRLCIARALALEPEVILMDEPTSHLDPISATKIEMLIRKLAENYTVVIVTHNMQQAARISDYVAFLYMGRLVEYGPTKEVFERPKNELTERYITGKIS
ncbi:MAG: phosphate ABC transporter ATP-binding protein [Candidatus Methanomethylicota archaeon]|jgi:phosphate transport system ATP-binding protein|uniref:Phosphate ABC transporter ATP-binding protein n=1 Tax=Thermoproteota archaeon TaxID=2056631 RepID=A0A523BH87_9CREN|nr:phosphate ABC transporter ATP-binding protein [Candidatus Verstraetearchaeota archaeon]RZN57090.1 MAG: phosphate ABC transporter ATP-binding protein [Candidatus Verstraetearchaeota archaeon]TDA40297.1 MAG: phosphate ABC transporter ATP-binding protein [Candidatus Verstraetearchaeota archaeon]